MVGRWAFYALQYLDRISRYTAATAVVVWTPEAIDLLVVDVEIYVRICFEAFKVVEFVARAHDTFLNFILVGVLRCS